MVAHLGKIALMVVMTHGFRAMGRLSNPRWAGLALGLPCSTAVALVGGGSDRGVDYAVAMSGTSLIGLAGAVALPVAYAGAIGRGWRLHWALILGIATYLAVTLSAGRVLPASGDASLGLAAMAVLAAVWAARQTWGDSVPDREKRVRLPNLPIRILRTIVPIACLLGSLAMGEAFGPQVAGLMSTFPGVSLTVLLLTHIESGRDSAIRMARALPAGNLGMVAFLAAFRFGCPTLGLLWGTVSGYLAALTMLALVIWFGAFRALIRRWIRDWNDSKTSRELARVAWPRKGRQFSPFLETFGA